MKNILKAVALVGALLMAGGPANAALVSVHQGYLIDEAALTHDANYDVNLQSQDIHSAAASADYSTVTFAASSFTDGSKATGSITMAEALTGLTTAYATNQITVVSTTGLAGTGLSWALKYDGVVLFEGMHWRMGATPAASALALKNALAARVPYVNFSVASNVIYATAAVASAVYNDVYVHSDAPSVVSVASARFTGGQDNAIIAVNGQPFRANKDWYPGASSATAATSLAAAINAGGRTAPYITATANSPTDGVIALASKIVGTVANFSLKSSTPAAAAVSGAAMTGGTNAAFALNGHNLSITDHGYSTGLPLLYTKGALAIGGLTDQTTYYAIAVDADNLALADSKAHALAGAYITFTSSAVPATADTYALAPLDIGGSMGLIWQGSNDGSTWADLVGVASVTYALSGSAVPTTETWSFSSFATKYLRAAVTGPDTGAVKLKLYLNGSILPR